MPYSSSLLKHSNINFLFEVFEIGSWEKKEQEILELNTLACSQCVPLSQQGALWMPLSMSF